MSSRPRVAVVVQARMGSSRLPGKVLREAGGRSLLAHLLERLRRARSVDEILIATTTSPADDELERAARALGAGVSRGSENDVLDRFARAIEPLSADAIVRVTADCPLLDPAELDRVVGEFLSRRGDPDAPEYVTNQAGNVRRIPRGLDVEVMSRAALTRAGREATAPGDREHVTPYLYRVPGRFRVLVTHYPEGDYSDLRLTVDTPEDLALVQAVFDALGADASFPEVARYLRAHPEVAALNANIEQKTIKSEDELRRERIAGRLLVARADAGPGIGFGHVARTLALLEAWVELGGRAELVGTGVTGALRERLTSFAHLSEEAPSPRELVARVSAAGAAAVVLDGYAFGHEEAALARSPLPLLVWDDLGERVPDADVILNQNLGASAAAYPGAKGRVLAGAPYLVLRREFRSALAELTARPAAALAAPRVLVAFGASDPAGMSPRVAGALASRLRAGARVTVIAGAGVSDQTRAHLERLGSETENVTVLTDPPSMTPLLAESDLAVLGAGSLAWEALALGVPCVLVAVAPNQQAVVRGAVGARVALDAGPLDSAVEERVASLALELLSSGELRRELSERARRLFDGRGCFRVIDALLDAIKR
jgi:spore coat polysaccharide biosynthesis protein SpsF